MSMPPSGKSIADWIASLPRDRQRELIEGLSPNAIAAMPYIFDLWALRRHQTPPAGDWTTWLILGGRGAGKTRAGAEWVRFMVEGSGPDTPGEFRRIALLGASLSEARDVMVMGESGIMELSPADRRPEWNAARWMLRWPNGAEATCFSAARPEKLRGPQFDGAWSDELGKWKNGVEAWEMLQLGLRLGGRPRQVVTTTPRANPLLELVLEDPSTVVTSAPTWENAANLADSFIDEVRTRFQGTTRGREELEGELVLDRPGAFWTREMLERARVESAPELLRIVVAVDPPASMGEAADECGIIVAGLSAEGSVYVIADLSCQGLSPEGWARRAVEGYHEFEADRMIAEVNQGGEMVPSLIRSIDPTINCQKRHASKRKGVRAEPVSGLYELGRVRHLGLFPELEDQMRAFGAVGFKGSPDRVDALVWAVTALVDGLDAEPRVRSL